ncbi:MAG: hypothetical protein BMS9Abin33_0305 [Gammaproteobacteria bacterium]|nr:MAG: hypothetical protein BMS9Abin33_0305 [Gammaproteobacteria bacterium]
MAIVLITILPATTVFAAHATCADDPATLNVISHDLTVSFCELCGTGQIRIVVSNPSEENMTNIVVSENIGAWGLEYVPGSSTLNGVGIADPLIAGSVLTWAGLPDINGTSNHFVFNNYEIVFSVRSVPGQEENLVNVINRNIEASVSFDYCAWPTATDTTGQEVLPIREPVLDIQKRGRNVDAAQGGYSDPVYGNTNDDVVWRLRFRNSGNADLQDLRIDDVMGVTNFDINYTCPTIAEALAVANNDGVAPGGSSCDPFPAANSLLDYGVDDPYGNPGNDEASGNFVEVPAGGTAFVYLVGKITSSCSNSVNTLSDVQWGCEVNPADGGITQTSTGASPGSDSATLSTLVSNNGLQVTRAITGTNTGQPVGSKGTVTLTIRNNTGGSVKNINLRDILPVEYVVDSTFTPTVAINPAYSNYAGMTDRITWTNPVANTFPLLSVNPLEPLANTAPEFMLWSSTTHPDYPDQFNMLRHGDVLTVTFRIVMIPPNYFDKVADLDVRTENTADSTDPVNNNSLSNQLFVEFEQFCTPGVTQFPSSYPYIDAAIPASPEDLDVDIAGLALVFILTNDPTQSLPLQVLLTNNGGHDATDYQAYVSFGTTMEVVSSPAGCSISANPPLLEVWDIPVDIPASATVYQCNSPPNTLIGPGQTRNLNFAVIKTSDPIRLAADDLSFRADVVGEVTLSDGTPLWFPTPDTAVINNRANNYSLDAVRARVVGFNLTKIQTQACTENNPPPLLPPNDLQAQIGEECSFRIDTGGWFGFQTPGFNYIAVQRIQVVDQLPNGQAYISSTDPTLTSDPEVLGISLNPPPAPLDEGFFDWTFNQIVPVERITVRDKWFRVDATTRLLNDPVDTIAAPNLHAAISRNVMVSTFEAVFNNITTGLDEIFLLGPGTVGYPQESVRRVDLTVTEPNILVTKQVCNETLYGAGTACSNFVDVANDGDTNDSYIYRVVLSNQANSAGVPRAPAYNVISTDTLDASDLMLVAPFGSDGLDNDGDGLIDGADPDGEGTISDNIVSNGTPAVITVSNTHSTPLLRIDPGASVTFYYRVDPDDAVAPLQTLTNIVSMSYDSLEGATGNQTVAPRANSDIAGARVYTTIDADAVVQILPVQTQPKQIINLSNTTLGLGTPQRIAVGEEVEYRLTTLIPVSQLRSFVIRDELPAGLRCVDAPVVDLDAAPYASAGFVPGGQFTPVCTNTGTNDYVEWDFGDQELTTAVGTRFSFPVNFIARVENTAGTNDSNILSNGSPATTATTRYINELGVPVVINFAQVDMEITEPRIVLTKDFTVATTDAGDILTVTVTATNTGLATAYNLRVLDNLAATEMTFMNSVSGADPPDNIDIVTFGPNQPIFTWNPANPDFAIAPGATISFGFQVRVDNTVQPLEILDDTLQASWTSLPNQTTALNSSGSIGADGSATGMRNGVVPNAGDAINDYETTATDSVTVPAITVTKTDIDPAIVPTIGVYKNYEIVIQLPEGVTNNLTVSDALDITGLSYFLANNASFDITYTFTGITSINGAAPAEGVFNSFPADNIPGTVLWDIGTIVTNQEDDLVVNAISPEIRINYYVRVNNDLVTDDGDTLQNTVTVGYDHGETAAPVTTTDTTPIVTVVEPLLAISKAVTNVTLGKLATDPPVAGDTLQYVVTINNSGTSTAYDVNIVDTLPAELSRDPGFVPTALINGVPVAGFVSTPANDTAGPLIWGRVNGDVSLDIPVGQLLVLTYQTLVDDNVLADTVISNSVFADWTSLDGLNGDERTGDGCPTITAPNDYCAGPAVAASATPDTNAISKTIIGDTWGAADAIVRAGDLVDYELRLQLQEGATPSITVVDTLPQGLIFEEVVSINGDTSAPYSFVSPFSHAAINPPVVVGDPTTGPTTVTWNVGNVINAGDNNPANDFFVIVYRARVLNNDVLAQVNTLTLDNSADLNYTTGTGTSTRTDTTTLTVNQPLLAVSKTAVPAGGDNIIEVNELINYTVDITNSGAAPAYDTILSDVIPAGLRNGTATITTVSTTLVVAGTVLPNVNPVYDSATGIATWNFDSGLADQYTIPVGETLRVVYQVQADATLGVGVAMTNQAQVQLYYSFDDEAVPALATSIGEREIYGPSNIASVTLTTVAAPVVVVEKTVTNLTTGQSPGLVARPGETLRYRIRLENLSTFALPDSSFTDDIGQLNASGRFVPGSLSIVTVPAGADTSNTNAVGGTNGTGLLDVRNLNLGAAGSGTETVIIEFDLILLPSIANGTIVLDQGQLQTVYVGPLNTDDPNVAGVGDPTPITIVSAPDMAVWKTSQDLTGDPGILDAGDTLRYTITVKNVGNEDSVNTSLRDQIPANTGYVANSTTLNGAPVADPAANVSALEAGMLINAPENTTPGFMRADPDVAANNMATISFDVVVSASAINGTVLSNQGFVNGDRDSGNPITEEPTDDPSTAIDDDPTVDIVGSLPLVDAQKTVVIQVDNGTPGIVDPGDVLRYTISVSNVGAVAATNVGFTDAVPGNTTYVADSVLLNGLAVGQPDGGVSPLIAGIPVSSSDLTPPLPTAGNGTLTPGQTAVVIFDVQVNGGVPGGTVISNQGVVSSNEQANEPTDADGIDANGDQPTDIVVGNAQLLSITKQVFVVGGGAALAGGQLEYIVTVNNISAVPATNVTITDNLDVPVAGQMTYVPGSGTLNGAAAGVSYAAPNLTADYAATYGDLLPGQSATLRFLVDIAVGLPTGTTLTNTGQVDWNAPIQTDTATVSIDIGGVPGVASLNGNAWHDANFNNTQDGAERALAGWFVDIYRNGSLLDTAITDTAGNYRITGLAPNDVSGDQYELRFRAPGAGANTALLGLADSVFTDNLQRISDIIVSSGSNSQNLNVPIDPDGVVYDSVVRAPVAGSTLTLLQAGTNTPVPTSCFDDANQQGQVTLANGYYKFDINFSGAGCSSGGGYIINVTPPASGYNATPSVAIPPSSSTATAAYSVPGCSADALGLPAGFCEAQPSEFAPTVAIPPATAGTNYYLHVTLNNSSVPGSSQLFNNHIPIDPELTNAVTISKRSSLVNVKRGELVPYTITINNTLAAALTNTNIVDTFPAGFRYMKGSARYDGVAAEPVINGRQLSWNNRVLGSGTQHKIQLLLVVGSGVSEGEYVNRARVFDNLTGTSASQEATATVRVVPDPTFDCTDVIGKVFDDANLNGYQDKGEKGIANARVVSARGLIMKTDAYGRFHITCAVVPNQDRGSNFILKLDERSLPSGYRVITENPRVQRATRGKMMKFNFGAAIHRVIRLDIADPVFEKGTVEIRPQWKPRLQLLLNELNKGAAILRISYLADTERSGLVDDRIDAIKQAIMKLRKQQDCCSALTIETEIFWRRGGPPGRGSVD